MANRWGKVETVETDFILLSSKITADLGVTAAMTLKDAQSLEKL